MTVETVLPPDFHSIARYDGRSWLQARHAGIWRLQSRVTKETKEEHWHTGWCQCSTLWGLLTRVTCGKYQKVG